jgi:hypothetical protein
MNNKSVEMVELVYDERNVVDEIVEELGEI